MNHFDQPLEAPHKAPNEEDLAALAHFCDALRRFLAFSEQVAAEHGVTMQWYSPLTSEPENPLG